MGENTATKNHLPPQAFGVSVDADPQSDSKWFDDDGRPKRTGELHYFSSFPGQLSQINKNILAFTALVIFFLS
jgi:hypothetical protein